MANILFIKTNPKHQVDSHTFKIAEAFITAYRQAQPNDTITVLDLDELNIVPHDSASFAQFMQGAGQSRELAEQFVAADKYIFAAPFWNFGIPARLKSYIDHITMPGLNFKYTETGPVGLLEGKKSLFITSRGGDYRNEPMKSLDFAVPYMATLLGFMGVTDHATISGEGQAYPGHEERLQEAITAAKEIAKTW